MQVLLVGASADDSDSCFSPPDPPPEAGSKARSATGDRRRPCMDLVSRAHLAVSKNRGPNTDPNLLRSLLRGRPRNAPQFMETAI